MNEDSENIWINISEMMPNDAGIYIVRRQWNENIIASGECYFDGMFWKQGNMEQLSGPITHWTYKTG